MRRGKDAGDRRFDGRTGHQPSVMDTGQTGDVREGLCVGGRVGVWVWVGECQRGFGFGWVRCEVWVGDGRWDSVRVGVGGERECGCGWESVRGEWGRKAGESEGGGGGARV